MPDAHWPLLPMQPLSQVPLDVSMPEEEYRQRLKECRKKLARLHNRLYRKKVPVVILYEGWDAAGKGGNIKRLAGALDPRGYEVVPIASPTPPEKSRHYLWRFWSRLPKTGHITIFDRSWYGRVMVERLEGFCTEADWKRAYNEINEFERELTQWGAVVVKFWVQIDRTPPKSAGRSRMRTGATGKNGKPTSRRWTKCCKKPARPTPPGTSLNRWTSGMPASRRWRSSLTPLSGRCDLTAHAKCAILSPTAGSPGGG